MRRRRYRRTLCPGERLGPDGKIRYSAAWLGDPRCPECGALVGRGTGRVQHELNCPNREEVGKQ
jgi:hypothetical protein